MTEGNRLAYFFAFLLAVLTNRGIRTVGLTNCTFSLISRGLGSRAGRVQYHSLSLQVFFLVIVYARIA